MRTECAKIDLVFFAEKAVRAKLALTQNNHNMAARMDLVRYARAQHDLGLITPERYVRVIQTYARTADHLLVAYPPPVIEEDDLP